MCICCVRNGASRLVSTKHSSQSAFGSHRCFCFRYRHCCIRCRTAMPLKRATFLFIYTKLPLDVLCVAVDFSQWIWIQSFVSLWRTKSPHSRYNFSFKSELNFGLLFYLLCLTTKPFNLLMITLHPSIGRTFWCEQKKINQENNKEKQKYRRK